MGASSILKYKYKILLIVLAGAKNNYKGGRLCYENYLENEQINEDLL